MSDEQERNIDIWKQKYGEAWEKFEAKEYIECEELFRECIKFSRDYLPYTRYQIDSLMGLTLLFKDMGKYDEINVLGQRALVLATEVGEDYWINGVRLFFGQIYIYLAYSLSPDERIQVQKAIDHAKSYLNDILRSRNVNSCTVKIFDNLGVLNYLIGNYSECVGNCLRALEGSKYLNNEQLFLINQRMARCYHEMNRFDEAYAYYMEVLKYVTIANMSSTHLEIAEFFYKFGFVEMALNFAKRASTYCLSDEDRFENFVRVQIFLAHLYIELNRRYTLLVHLNRYEIPNIEATYDESIITDNIKFPCDYNYARSM